MSMADHEMMKSSENDKKRKLRIYVRGISSDKRVLQANSRRERRRDGSSGGTCNKRLNRLNRRRHAVDSHLHHVVITSPLPEKTSRLTRRGQRFPELFKEEPINRRERYISPQRRREAGVKRNYAV